jgi:hypothetical protein
MTALIRRLTSSRLDFPSDCKQMRASQYLFAALLSWWSYLGLRVSPNRPTTLTYLAANSNYFWDRQSLSKCYCCGLQTAETAQRFQYASLAYITLIVCSTVGQALQAALLWGCKTVLLRGEAQRVSPCWQAQECISTETEMYWFAWP